MRVYIHEGAGHYIGSAAICFAESLEQAQALIRQRLDEAGLRDEPLNIRDYRADVPGVIFFDSGDY